MKGRHRQRAQGKVRKPCLKRVIVVLKRKVVLNRCIKNR